MSDFLNIPGPEPFWFVRSELLMEVLRAEISLVARFLAKHPELPDWFDDPEIEIEQRKICFRVTARRSVMSNISDTIANRQEPYAALTNEESDTFSRISNLVAPDAPPWALEMVNVAERMPWHLSAALPEELRGERFDESSGKQNEAVNNLSTLEQLQTFIQTELDRQLTRLEVRWRPSPAPDHRLAELESRLHATVDARVEEQLILTRDREQTTPDRRRNKRTGWEQREKLYAVIRSILKDNPKLQGIKFCGALDKRHAPPLYDWKKRGQWRDGLTWKEAWRDPKLCRKIRRVRQEAQRRR